jgi:peptidoglycan/xylan/chitin deacetylase (PgdA/CDA1 family)
MKPKFIVTIDTETFRVNGRVLPFGTHHYGELSSGTFGVQRIMDICDSYGAKATFFVDIYMHRHYGEAPVADLCQRIDRAGHDVQLHAHTSWFPDSKTGLIREYSLARQTEVLGEGKALIQSWIGRSPVGFRAGAYGANLDTIRALKANDFKVDSSYFPRNNNCELYRQLPACQVNQTFSLEGLLEIPVTTYWLVKNGAVAKNSKIDVNACSTSELRRVLKLLSFSPIRYVVLFLHSFSFVRWDKNGDNLKPRTRPIGRLESLLKFVRYELDGEFATVAETVTQGVGQDINMPDYVPLISPLYIVPRLFARIIN